MTPGRASTSTAAATHVAFLRGINVGKAKRVAMADLRALVAGLGHRNVGTLLNSGNVVFTAPGQPDSRALGRAIERAIEARLELTSRVTVLTVRELRGALDENPLGRVATEPSRLLVAILATAADRSRLDHLRHTDWSPEVLAIGTRVAYLWCPDGQLGGRLAESVARALGDAVTVRNWATLSKLAAMAGA